MLIEIHMLQNHSPSNLNRDDLGAPKTCIFGGVPRARISSQCLKRSIRNPGNPEDIHNRGAGIFFEAMKDFIALRTKYFPDLVKAELATSNIPRNEHDEIVRACEKIAKKEEGEPGQPPGESELDDRPRLPQLVFVERSEAAEFVKKLQQMRSDNKWKGAYDQWRKGKLANKPQAEFLRELSEAYKRRSVDIALFGRMTTSDAFEDVEAAMQVAHAFSTHEVVNEVDYFTAVDDLGKSGGGAGHVDEAMFNSACFYKYFCLDWDQLVKNLGGGPEAERLAAATLGHFLRAAALTTPSGKQNSFAAHNPPDGILVEIKKNARTLLSYANAFVQPIDPTSPRGLVGQSVAQLGQYVHDLLDGYGIQAERFWFSPSGRNRLTWVDHDVKPEQEKPVVTPEDRNIKSFDTLVERIVKEATDLSWSEIKDPSRAQPREA